MYRILYSLYSYIEIQHRYIENGFKKWIKILHIGIITKFVQTTV